jgi:hypothetical protein
VSISPPIPPPSGYASADQLVPPVRNAGGAIRLSTCRVPWQELVARCTRFAGRASKRSRLTGGIPAGRQRRDGLTRQFRCCNVSSA